MGFFEKFFRFFKEAFEVSHNLSKKYKKSAILIFFDIFLCTLKYKASPKNYETLGFIDLDSSQRSTYLTFDHNRKLIAKYNDLSYVSLLKDKYVFSKEFAEFHRRKCVLTDDISYEDFLAFIEGETKILYKPIQGAKGMNIQVIDLREIESVSQLFEELKSLPTGILETWIVQHKELSALYPQAVNPVRITTLYAKGKVHFMTSTLSIGHNSQIANASINALFALVDVNTGRLLTDACDYDGGVYKEHPETGIAFKDFQIPFWQETLDMTELAAKKIPQMGYIGWDIAITESGPVIIEGNHDPGYIGFQLPLFVNGHGTRGLYKDFLD